MTNPAPEPTFRAHPRNLGAAAQSLSETWSPRLIGRVNDVVVKVARFDGDFVWHNHSDTDEAFLCLSGSVTIELRDTDQPRTITLEPGDFTVIPRGVDHCPRAAKSATVALFEAAGVVNTGDTDSSLTAAVDVPLDD
jgi:mannose-6-phosphate isomerase-like protein (cupin superfamily)